MPSNREGGRGKWEEGEGRRGEGGNSTQKQLFSNINVNNTTECDGEKRRKRIESCVQREGGGGGRARFLSLLTGYAQNNSAKVMFTQEK